MDITSLKAKGKYPGRFVFRGYYERGRGGRRWWRVILDSDIPAKLVGDDVFLPTYAYDQLQVLRQEPVVGQIRERINMRRGVPHSRGDLDAFFRSKMSSTDHNRTYILIDDPSYELWEFQPSSTDEDPLGLYANYKLIWKDQ